MIGREHKFWRTGKVNGWEVDNPIDIAQAVLQGSGDHKSGHAVYCKGCHDFGGDGAEYVLRDGVLIYRAFNQGGYDCVELPLRAFLTAHDAAMPHWAAKAEEAYNAMKGD